MFKKITEALLGGSLIRRILTLLLLAYLLAALTFSFIWSTEPELFDVVEKAQGRAAEKGEAIVTGYISAHTAVEMLDILLFKPGGYLTNDIAPPGIWLDNIPEWEFGVVVQLRDFVRIMRNDLSRSQSQSKENPHLVGAENRIFFDNDSWWLPSTESQYKSAKGNLENYLRGLSKGEDGNHFYARADNLAEWLKAVETRLGSLAQNLGASRGHTESSHIGPKREKTPWHEIDNIFYQARGQTYALIHLLKSIEQDFGPVLEDKNATEGLANIIGELEASQLPIYSLIILNGSEFGIWANHSLVMAAYISRANAGIIDLRRLLSDG